MVNGGIPLCINKIAVAGQAQQYVGSIPITRLE